MSSQLLNLGRTIKRVQDKHHRQLDAALTAIGLSLSQFDALRAIANHAGASAHELAQITFMTDQSFGALAGRMIDKGLVGRMPGRGRAICHTITEKGNEALAQGIVIADRVLHDSFAPLSPVERTTLMNLLGRLVDGGVAR